MRRALAEGGVQRTLQPSSHVPPRLHPRLLAVAALVALAACSDATAPTAASLPEPPAPPASVVNPAVYLNAIARTDDSIVVDFTVTPSGGWFAIGYNAVYFPPNAICEPATSGYGPDTWDAPCTPATRPIRVRGRTGATIHNRGWVHFDTDLRFVPTSDPAQWVRIYMWSRELRGPQPQGLAAQDEITQRYHILWVPTPGAAPVDDALDDATLRTQVLWGTGLVTRRVKHFSGYVVGSGRAAQVESVEGVESVGMY
jgi:hypothetical protein